MVTGDGLLIPAVPGSLRLTTTTTGIASAALGTLVRGGWVVGVTKGRFSMIDLIEATLDQTGPGEVWCSTWTPGIADFERIGRLLQAGTVTRFFLLVDRSTPGRQPQYVQRILDICGPDAIRMSRTHMKVSLISAGDWRVSIRGSLNLNTSPRCENIDICDDARVFDHFLRVFDEVSETVPPGLHASPGAVDAGFSGLMEAMSDDRRAAFTDKHAGLSALKWKGSER